MRATTIDSVQAGIAPRREVGERREARSGAAVRLKARLAGTLELAVIATSMFAFLVQSPMTVPGDAAATAANLLASEPLFRVGLTSNLAAGICYLGVTVLLYAVLKPAGRSLSLLAATLGLAGVTVGAAATLLQLASLTLLNGGSHPGAFTPDQLRGLAYTLLRMDANVFQVSMLFFGLQVAMWSTLILRSTFLPRALGVLLGLGGLSYLASSLVNLVAPALGARLGLFVIPAALVGEGALALWLVLKGVDAGRWQEQAARQ